jgi:hypothetical protein
LFEALGRGAGEGACGRDSNCKKCECEFFHSVLF